MVTARNIVAINVPFDMGAGLRGVHLGPNAILQSGLEDRLQQLNLAYEHRGEIGLPPNLSPIHHPVIKNLAEVTAINMALADVVSDIVKNGQFPLVLGGDHSISIGTIAGIAEHYSNLGVIWVDAHSDLNTEATSPSGNIHGMSLAVSLGQGHPALTGIRGYSPKIKPGNVVIIGARSLDPGEKTYIRSQGITCYTMHDIDRKGIGPIIEEAIRKLSDSAIDGVHLSFDVDSLDPLEAPGTGTPVSGGMSYREAHFTLELLHQAGIITSAEFVEVNPTLDTNNKTAQLSVELIASLLGEQIL
jgi:arginase